MVTLDTKRLTILALDVEQFRLLLNDWGALALELGVVVSGEALTGHVREAMEGLYLSALENPDSHPWHTNWQIIAKKARVTIGSACFMGGPDAQGTVEIGYGIHAPYRSQGYMTEALTALCDWALSQPGVSAVIAETENANLSSRRVLQKVGMRIFRDGESSWWRLSRTDSGPGVFSPTHRR